jgi:hypothetical protein
MRAIIPIVSRLANELGAKEAAELERLDQLRTVGFLAAFNLHKLFRELPVAIV